MTNHVYECPNCGTPNSLGYTGPSTIVEIPCYSCESVFEVNRYKMKVL